jgi:hypothetical protein
VDEAFETLIEPLVGHENGVYRFFLLDSGSNGIGDGFYRIFSGTTDTSDESNAVVSGAGNSYTDHAEHIFIARKPGDNMTLPSDSPFLTLKIKMDDYPEDLLWVLKANDDETAMSRAVTTQSVIDAGPPVPYSADLAGQVVTTEIKFPAISAGATRGFTFFLIDTKADGLCCANGKGSYQLYLGDPVNNELIASGSAENTGRVVHDFALSDTGVESTDSTSSGSASTMFFALVTAIACALFLTSLK